MSLIEVDGVSKTFLIPDVKRDTLREHALGVLTRRGMRPLKALDAVTFTVEHGETLGIMGGNGSGKSTLLKVLCGIYQADRGSVHVRGAITSILELGVGWNPELDALDNVQLMGTVMGLSLADVRRRMDEILDFAEVAPFARLKLKHYSSGMASRLAYAVAFAAVREVLVLDEVFSVGDASFRARCEERFRQLKTEGHTVLMVSHDPQTIATFCDKAILLDHGRLVFEGTGSAVADRYLLTLGCPAASATGRPS